MQVITNVVLFIVAWICLATLVAAGFARFFSQKKRRAELAETPVHQNLHSQRFARKSSTQLGLRANWGKNVRKKFGNVSLPSGDAAPGQIIDLTQRNNRKKAN